MDRDQRPNRPVGRGNPRFFAPPVAGNQAYRPIQRFAAPSVQNAQSAGNLPNVAPEVIPVTMSRSTQTDPVIVASYAEYELLLRSNRERDLASYRHSLAATAAQPEEIAAVDQLHITPPAERVAKAMIARAKAQSDAAEASKEIEEVPYESIVKKPIKSPAKAGVETALKANPKRSRSPKPPADADERLAKLIADHEQQEARDRQRWGQSFIMEGPFAPTKTDAPNGKELRVVTIPQHVYNTPQVLTQIRPQLQVQPPPAFWKETGLKPAVIRFPTPMGVVQAPVEHQQPAGTLKRGTNPVRIKEEQSYIIPKLSGTRTPSPATSTVSYRTHPHRVQSTTSPGEEEKKRKLVEEKEEITRKVVQVRERLRHQPSSSEDEEHSRLVIDETRSDQAQKGSEEDLIKFSSESNGRNNSPEIPEPLPNVSLPSPAKTGRSQPPKPVTSEQIAHITTLTLDIINNVRKKDKMAAPVHLLQRYRQIMAPRQIDAEEYASAVKVASERGTLVEVYENWSPTMKYAITASRKSRYVDMRVNNMQEMVEAVAIAIRDIHNVRGSTIDEIVRYMYLTMPLDSVNPEQRYSDVTTAVNEAIATGIIVDAALEGNSGRYALVETNRKRIAELTGQHVEEVPYSPAKRVPFGRRPIALDEQKTLLAQPSRNDLAIAIYKIEQRGENPTAQRISEYFGTYQPYAVQSMIRAMYEASQITRRYNGETSPSYYFGRKGLSFLQRVQFEKVPQWDEIVIKTIAEIADPSGSSPDEIIQYITTRWRNYRTPMRQCAPAIAV
ncbi:mediator of DNA damage checkpoint protein 1-like isoform X4 [Paramacrobiotus metropolitanus]|uniref:mediator of DNA damage checkpoint protein 1-like isoform X4 n=1 Tax=Paramacrobiotus metropolitanus TaxID=2943436 RepID=UPI002445A071|nr:mediator of DNA damage checkpoint protein 1-like isoform X4 [Paramacrobiotus metropolitanus]